MEHKTIEIERLFGHGSHCYRLVFADNGRASYAIDTETIDADTLEAIADHLGIEPLEDQT